MFNTVYEHLITETIDFIRSLYKSNDFIPLHAPIFSGNERAYLMDTIDSTFVSSVGEYVSRFEEEFAAYVGAKYAVAMVNGTAALHIALSLLNISNANEVLISPLTFVAPCNAIRYCNADPIFIDIEKDTLGICPDSLRTFLDRHTVFKNGHSINKETGKIIKACILMHVFGFPSKIEEILSICRERNIITIEDASEGLGSFYQGKHVGTFSECGVFSFNGNKVLTTGGGGMLVTDNQQMAEQAKHITTTGKQSHPWEYYHDVLAYNYRLPNLNAALGCAQLEMLPKFLVKKRELSNQYKAHFNRLGLTYFDSSENRIPNYWLNTLLLEDSLARDVFLKTTNENGIMTRPAWRLMNDLPMYQCCQSVTLSNAVFMQNRLVNIPSTPILS